MASAARREGLTPAPPSISQHEELVACALRRFARARVRLERAQTEFDEANAALGAATEARADWIANCPGDEPLML